MIPVTEVTAALAPATANAVEVERLIASATATLGRELGRYLGGLDQTVEHQSGGFPMILLYDEPVTDTDDGGDVEGQTAEDSAAEEAIFQVEARAYPTAVWEVVPTTDYVVEGRALRHGTAWPCGRSNVRITYSRGFAAGNGPTELRDLVLRMVLARLKRRGTEGLQSETIGDYSYTKVDLTDLDGWPMIAARWRRTRI